MSFKCSYSDCSGQAKMECDEGLYFCINHVDNHTIDSGCCKFSPLFIKILNSKYKSSKNAIKKLYSERIQLAKKIVIEIHSCIKASFAVIKGKKIKLKNFILKNQYLEVEKIKHWAENYALINWEVKEFTSNTRNLFCIDENLDKKISVLDTLKNEIENLKKTCNEANNKINDQEKELNAFKDFCTKKQYENEEITKKYIKASNNYDEAVKKLYECEKYGQEIENYKTERISNTKKYDEACKEINDLKKELNKAQNSSKIKDNALKEYEDQKNLSMSKFESEIKDMKTSLEKNYDRKKKELENDISKYQLSIQSCQADKKQLEVVAESRQKSLKQAESQNYELNIEIANLNKTIQDMQEKIKELENKAQISGKYLEQIKAKNKQLENGLINCQKVIEEKQEIKEQKIVNEKQEEIKNNESKVQTMQKSLEKTNTKGKQLENKPENCQKTIEVEKYDANIQSKIKSLDQAEIKIKSIENNIANEKNIEETKELLKKNESKLSNTQNSPLQDLIQKFAYPSVGNF